MAAVDAAEQEREQLNTGTKDVAVSHRFDEAALAAWMSANVEGYAGPLEVRQFKGGQSNPTYQLITPGKKYVLRRKPPGKLLPSAHAVDREYKVITALGTTGFPVAKTYGLCTDDGVIGTWFYIMDMVEGRILWDQTLPQYEPAERHAIFMHKIKTLADLHNTDYAKIGLEDYGRPGNYMGRQVDRWTKQYKASETAHIPEMERLIDWLPKTLPAQERTAIVHGDYRLDNMIFHPTEPRVIAVLDWELSTLGEPLADFTYLLMNWVNGSISTVPDLKAHGLPTLDETVDYYCSLTGRTGLHDLNWFFSYNAFRLAGILQGIVGRVRDGTANSPHAAQQADRVVSLAQASWKFAEKAGALA
ncbi:phosphotransferase [Phenylobacterium sp.]|uniref:phosphotransferase n=1 Tax=Phenylobacterium sp. TaxID=1871053 RepID=UPI00120BD2F5|nr:phosphotransferase [Phenylobacterium sp.]THD58889.1 MAG: phosphotransferase family protein [Phenylobacterium sp.]